MSATLREFIRQTLNEVGQDLGREASSNGQNVLYSFVPRKNLDSIEEYGLASSRHIKENEKLLRMLYPDTKMRNDWLSRYDKNDITLQGPSIFFQKPDISLIKSLNPNHSIFEDDLVLIQIDYGRLSRDVEAGVFGLELIPYEESEYKLKKSEIEHKLSDDEIQKEMNKDSNNAWQHYFNDGGYFAPNVPHGILLVDSGVIPYKYLDFAEGT